MRHSISALLLAGLASLVRGQLQLVPTAGAQPVAVQQSSFSALPVAGAQPGVVQQAGFVPQQVAGQQQSFVYPQNYDPVIPLPLTDGERLVGVAQKRLRACCSHLTSDVDYECKRRFCTFEAWNPNNVFLFMTLCAARGTTVYELWDCASSRRDHTQCCIRKGVSEGCLAYCDATYGMATDSSQLIGCQSFLNPIRECFWEYMEMNPNMYGEY